ncbi:M20 family metallopeptidase [Brevibacterium sp. 50QC2O2]|uniref:M20 metallopeptidase family protein n=1 Tax=Brevibacterium sp. 50QC2O2 TaxID=2968459 RepID=UPI00211C6524|nr:M20 family metallopeptidase [Brevibacterium sp. 50QC2O2]MCQ9389884.1 M20 family metallopeptidase [Brevibacterium sp. 50QC2O2]
MSQTSTTPDFRAEAAALSDDLVALRRDLHQHPEIGLQLPYTQGKILEELEGLGLEIHTGTGLSSVVAILRGGASAKESATKPVTVLLRGDMDALPVVEQTGLEYASTNGAMHACGHDLHVTGLVGAARLLAAHRDELPGDVVFMFQPGEEGDGGAKVMLDEGMWDTVGGKVDGAYGLHVSSGPRGVFTLRPGTLMAGANRLNVTFHGRGGHSSQPSKSIDPVRPAAEYVGAMYQAIGASFSVFDPVVTAFTQMSGGDAINVIPPHASVGASVRTLSRESTRRFPEVARRVADHVAAAHGCTAEVEFVEQYPVTVNDDAEAAFVLDELTGVFGAERVIESPDPQMGSEDFSYVLEEVPGAYYFLGASPEGVDPETAATNHSPQVLFDDALLSDSASSLALIAWARLHR